MRIVIAPDKFKGSLDADGVAAALADGLRSVLPDAEIDQVPVADGGEGTVGAALGAGFTAVEVSVAGPVGDPVRAVLAVSGATAVVELAAASGLDLLPAGFAPLTAGTHGTGQLIAAALDAGCTRIVLGVGGSASTDGGTGMLAALGARLLDADGAELAPGGGALARLAELDLSGVDPRLAGTEFVLAADVTNPLLGPDGAAAVFGPQKGATAADVAVLDAALARFAEHVPGGAATLPGAGAAGGVGFAALAVLGAVRRPGIEVVRELVRLDERLAGADVVITGEGSLDGQSLGGKSPVGVAAAARAHGVLRVLAVCGRNRLDAAQAREAGFDRVYALADREPDPARSMAMAAELLTALGREIGAGIGTGTWAGPGAEPCTGTGAEIGQLAEVNRPEVVAAQLATHLADHPPAPARPATVTEPGRFDLVVRGERVVTPAGIGAHEVGVRNGVIEAVEPLGTGLAGAEVLTLARDETLLPGLVDAHVHVNEPGRTEWEGFASATKAAAAGGVTTILDMPLNSVPSTVTLPALQLKQAVAAPQAFVDVGFWGGAVPGNRKHLAELRAHGVFGFKCFLLHSGVDEFPPLDPDQLEGYLRVLRELDAPMIVHAEHAMAIDRAPAASGRTYGRFLASRPRGAENLAIAELIERTRWTGARTHVLHLSSSDALPMLRTAKADGLAITAETCPHYLTLTAEDVPDGATPFKCCPPIRERDNRDRLWAGLLDGTIDDIASDHSPCTADLKQLESGDFGGAWGGVASLQLALPVVWTEARRRGIELERVVGWLASRPARRVGLPAKGELGVGFDADLSVFAADDTFVVDAEALHHRNAVTPYQGRTLSGVVRRTFVRGVEVDFATPRGSLLRR